MALVHVQRASTYAVLVPRRGVGQGKGMDRVHGACTTTGVLRAQHIDAAHPAIFHASRSPIRPCHGRLLVVSVPRSLLHATPPISYSTRSSYNEGLPSLVSSAATAPSWCPFFRHKSLGQGRRMRLCPPISPTLPTRPSRRRIQRQGHESRMTRKARQHRTCRSTHRQQVRRVWAIAW